MNTAFGSYAVCCPQVLSVRNKRVHPLINSPMRNITILVKNNNSNWLTPRQLTAEMGFKTECGTTCIVENPWKLLLNYSESPKSCLG